MSEDRKPKQEAAAALDPEHELPVAAGDESGEAAGESLRRLEAERDELRDRWLRARADLDNQRKRAQRESAEQRTHATVDVVRAILPALDAIDLALAHPTSGAVEFRTGIELIQRQIEESLRRLGIEPISGIGQPFDPHLQEAIEMVEGDGAAAGTVVGELQRGYRFKDRLIRPARVRVAK